MVVIYAMDTETGLTIPANQTPDMVCWTGSDGTTADGPFTPDTLAGKLEECLRRKVVTAWANGVFDFGCLVKACPESVSTIFALYREGLVYDVLIAEQLAAIGEGTLGRDPRTGQPIRSEQGKQTGAYSLHFVSSLHLGQDEAKYSGFWRKRYRLLRDVPIAKWLPDAGLYPREDALKTAQTALAQLELFASGRYANYHDLAAQAETAWCLHLGSIWGLRTDPERVSILEGYVKDARAEVDRRLQALGFLRTDGTQDQAAIKRAVVRAYAPDAGRCEVCRGTGKTPTGKNGNAVTCVDCDGTGLELTPDVPRTETGKVSKDRDTLLESDHQDLIDLSESEVVKVDDTYLPELRKGVRDPICPRPNVLVESGRVSYSGLVQLMPRRITWPKGFEPPKEHDFGVRGCFKARPGYYYVSVDYAALELCTLAQVCLWVVGHSEMAQAINESGDPGLLHTRFAASLVGKSVDEVLALLAKKDPAAKGWRQAAKAANFGFPGGMGSAKLVLAKRKRSEGETIGRSGRIYPGIRFCIALGGDPECGTQLVTKWRGRDYPPLCKRCVEIVENDLRPGYFRQWSEMKPYFAWVSSCVETQGGIACLSPSDYVDGAPLVDRYRGGVDFCSAANNGFQALASDLAKASYRAATREAYLDRESALWGSRFPVFAHDEIFGEVPQSRAHEAAHRLADLMISEGGRYTPDVRLDAKPALSIYWLKEAEARYDEGGRLIPWDL